MTTLRRRHRQQEIHNAAHLMHPGADSNDTALIDHIDADITVWSNGKALAASGLPIPPLDYDGQRYEFGPGGYQPFCPAWRLVEVASGVLDAGDDAGVPGDFGVPAALGGVGSLFPFTKCPAGV
jgi:Malic enzyme, NAD binding domain